MKIKEAIAILFIAVLAATEPADAQQLVDRQTGKYLGNLGGNKYDPNSTSNPYGRSAVSTPPIPSTTRTVNTDRNTATTARTIHTLGMLPRLWPPAQPLVRPSLPFQVSKEQL